MSRIKWLLVLLLGAATSVLGTNFVVSVGVADCCTDDFSPPGLLIDVGDTVTFFLLAGATPHNVVADDGSFRCARGCDGEGGDGTPAGAEWSFTRAFTRPGIVDYHDEGGTHGTGTIVVRQPAFVISPGLTGAWYDPSQSGHGLFIEVLSDNRFYASWFAFNPAGTEQSWFTGVGTYSGITATISAVEQPTGGRWIPNFDPNSITRNSWGTLGFTFTDCDHGRVYFNSVAGYGAGSMNLTRLTQPVGLTCP